MTSTDVLAAAGMLVLIGFIASLASHRAARWLLYPVVFDSMCYRRGYLPKTIDYLSQAGVQLKYRHVDQPTSRFPAYSYNIFDCVGITLETFSFPECIRLKLKIDPVAGRYSVTMSYGTVIDKPLVTNIPSEDEATAVLLAFSKVRDDRAITTGCQGTPKTKTITIKRV